MVEKGMQSASEKSPASSIRFTVHPRTISIETAA
jgi:hypothetical protein